MKAAAVQSTVIRRALTGLVAVVMLALCGCTPTKNNAWTRNYQAFITRYNVYYNGDIHEKETLEEMEQKYEDDYSRTLYVHPASARSNPDAPQPTGNFDRSIEKAQKAIQTRSIKRRPAPRRNNTSDPAYKEWRKREEYNPFLHNAWLMMGRAQYYNGDFAGAASTFYYISRHFPWLPSTVTEARIWQARCYVDMGWLFEAENILSKIKPDEVGSKSVRGVYDMTYASFWLRSGEPAKAVPYLEGAVKAASGAQKTRLRYLLGQALALAGDRDAAYREFGKVAGASGAPYRTRFNARIRQSEVYTGSDIEKEIKSLRAMTRYDSNSEYLDQVYYAIGNIYLARGDTARAIENYTTAVEKSTRNGLDKAIAETALANLYFQLRKYVKAQEYYASAIPVLPQSYPDYKTLSRRSTVLDRLAVFAQNVELQDSLLRLAAMPEEQRMKIIEGIIADLERQKKEEEETQRREEYLAAQDSRGNSNLTPTSSAAAPSGFTLNNDKSWYFYNQTVRNAGKAEFQRRWGSRKLEDNWRRRNKNTFADEYGKTEADNSGDDTPLSDSGNDGDDAVGKDSQAPPVKSDDPLSPEYYLAQIPFTEAEQANARDIIQEGLYNMGLILKDDLEDYGVASVEFERLLREYPDNVFRLDIYYNMYLMCAREHKTDEAEKWRSLILSDFPDSKYGMAMRDPLYLEKLAGMDAAQEELYSRTYEAYLANRNEEVHEAYHRMVEDYPLSRIMPKFMFLHALAYVTERRPDDFVSVLRDIVSRYPDSDVSPLAAAWMQGIASGRKLHEGAANIRGMVWDTRLAADSMAVESADSIAFTIDPASPQLVVLLYPTDKVNANALLYDVAYFNFNTFTVKDFDLEQMNFGMLGILIVSGFDNQAQVDRYRRIMAESDLLDLPSDVRIIDISKDNFDRLLHGGGSFEQYIRFINDSGYDSLESFEDSPEDTPEIPLTPIPYSQ